MTQNGLEEIPLRIELEKVGVEALSAQLVINLGRTEQFWRLHGGGAKLGDLGQALGFLRSRLLRAKQLGGLLIILNGEFDTLLCVPFGTSVSGSLVVLKQLCNLLRQLGSLS